MTLQPISRQAIESRLKLGGKYSGVSIIKTIAYVQPLNLRPDPKN